MRTSELKELLDRVLSWPKVKQEAAFDTLVEIENEHAAGREFDDDMMRMREDSAG
jgi:hypothetical protein